MDPKVYDIIKSLISVMSYILSYKTLYFPISPSVGEHVYETFRNLQIQVLLVCQAGSTIMYFHIFLQNIEDK